MTSETDLNRDRKLVSSVLPWVLGAGMLVVYLTMIYRTVTPNSLSLVSDINGWNRPAHVFGPVTYLLTYPIRWLPAAITPLVLNVFSAVCAALSLAFLARSVVLLPHDRTNEQRQRELSDHSTLSIRSAWLPPLLAVLACGLQLTFWENAIQFRVHHPFLPVLDTGEMLNLLMFAYVIRALLEYRIHQTDSWMFRAALVYGLGMANNWIMVGFFPAFLVSVVWIKGLDFFNWRFVLRLFGIGLAGLSLILLLPVVVGITGKAHWSEFWQALRQVLSMDKFILTRMPKETLLLLSLTSVVPVLIMGFRWATSFGDNSPLGVFLATSAFNVAHGGFLIACLWCALDSPFSPRQTGLDIPFLAFYYLGALSIGYFCGYFLLVFGTRPARPRKRSNPLVRYGSYATVVLVWLLASAAPALLVHKNLAQTRKEKASVAAFDRYFQRLEKALPTRPAVVLSDDPTWLYYLQSALDQSAGHPGHLLVDTGALGQGWDYWRQLDKRNPDFGIRNSMTNNDLAQPVNILCVRLLENLAERHDIYYAHPSFGYFYERFYAQPRGLLYQLQLYPTNVWTMPPLNAEQLAQNTSFWQAIQGDMDYLKQATEPYRPPALQTRWQALRDSLMNAHESDLVAETLSRYYSRALVNWGVELSKAGRNEEAGGRFQRAQELDADNVSAEINLDFNREQLHGIKPVLRAPKTFEDKLGRHRNWMSVLNQCGPFNEPSFCSALGVGFANGLNYRQAIQQFDRAQALAPENATIPLMLSQLYLLMPYRLNDAYYSYPLMQSASNSFAAAEQALRIDPGNTMAMLFQGYALIEQGNYEQALAPLNRLLSIQSTTTNYAAVLNRAIAHLKLRHLDEARRDYEMVAGVAPNAYQVNYGLGEVAYLSKDYPAAIKYYEMYLSNSPPEVKESEEAKTIVMRLKELKNDRR